MDSSTITKNDYFKKSQFYQYFIDNPIGFIDVGARGGSHSLVEPLHSHVSFLGFEPDQEECDLLNKDDYLKKYWNQFEILPHALSNAHAKKTLNILSSPTNSSLLTPNPIFVSRYNMDQKWTVTKKIDMETVPLDYVMYELKLGFKNSGEFIKLDTQGTECEILEGAKQLLTEKTVCVVTEVEFFQIYKDQKLFADVELYLRELGFSFYGFLTQHTRSKKILNKKTNLGKERLFYADAVFFKDPFNGNLNLNQRHYHVLMFSAMLTGYFDFALELAMSPYLNLSGYELSNIKNLIESLSHVDPVNISKKIDDLARQISGNKENTNVILGKFIDSLGFPDFEDCLLMSSAKQAVLQNEK